jgi:predicted AlkP superfamily phosphohydrolase/phosphomutase
MSMPSTSRRVVALGLDAAERQLVDAMLRDGDLPVLASLLERGERGDFQSGHLMRAEMTWTQLQTGIPPERNGYWSNVVYDPATYTCHDQGAQPSTPFWKTVPGCVPVIFDVPHSVVDPVGAGVIVTAWGAHSPLHPRASRPQGLLTEIEERFGRHPALFQDELPCWYDEDYLRSFTRDLCAGAQLRADVFTWLLERQPDWTFAMTAFSEPHSIGHHTWHGVDPQHRAHGAPTAGLAGRCAREVYRAVDDAIGRVIARLDDDVTVMVFGAHGMQANRTDTTGQVLVPELLFRHQFGRPHFVVPGAEQWLAEGAPLRTPVTTWGAEARTGFATGLGGSARRALARALPDATQQMVADARARRRGDGPSRLAYGHIDIPPEAPWPLEPYFDDLSYQAVYWYQPWWSRMAAFGLPTFSDPHIRLNLEQREGAGVIPVAEYRRACDELVSWLAQLRDARTGLHVLADVVLPRRDDPLDPYAPAPDIVPSFTTELEAVWHPEAGLVGPVAMMRTGEHSHRAWAVTAGRGIAKGTAAHELDALVIPRTLRALLTGADALGDVLVRAAQVEPA